MTNKELLEAAAKAAGIDNLYWTKDGQKLFRRDGGIQKPWNPITDDGDALRLAVKLRLSVNVGDESSWVRPDEDSMDEFFTMVEMHNGDPYAATRRAIVRAAAEIGERMK